MDLEFLRDRLYEPPSAHLFKEVINRLDTSKALPEGLDDYLCEHLSQWPAHIQRPVPSSIIRRVQYGEAVYVGPWFNFMRYPLCTPEEFVEVTKHPVFAEVVGMEMYMRPDSRDVVDTLLQSELWDRLRSFLCQLGCESSDPDLNRGDARLMRCLLQRSPLESFVIKHAEPEHLDLDIWEGASFWKTLRVLHLMRSFYYEQSASPFPIAIPKLCGLLDEVSSLHTLCIDGCGLSDEHAALLASREDLVSLEHLLLGDNAIGDEGVEALCASPYLKNLRMLDLGQNPIGARGAAYLTSSPTHTCLETLSLTIPDVDTLGPLLTYRPFFHGTIVHSERIDGIRPIRKQGTLSGLSAPFFMRYHRQDPNDRIFALRRLSPLLDFTQNLDKILIFSACVWDLKNIQRLASAPHLAQVSALFFDRQELYDGHLHAFAQSNHLRSLRVLSLAQNRLTTAGLLALARSKTLRSLEVLDLRDNAIDDEGAKLLTSRVHFPSLLLVLLRDNPVTEHGVECMRESHLISDLYVKDLPSPIQKKQRAKPKENLFGWDF